MSPQETDDVKDMKVAGCDVHLAFVKAKEGWIVVGTVASGISENKNKETITSGPWANRDQAEQLALEALMKLLGHNVDRHTSRVNNPGETTTPSKVQSQHP